MTDIEKLRDDVITASWSHYRCQTQGTHERLGDTLNALDAAMRPDPWDILGRIRIGTNDPMLDEVLAALRWRRDNPDA